MNIGKSSNTIVPILGLFAVAAYRTIPSLTRIMNSVQNIKYSYPAIAPFISEFKDKESLTVLGEQKTTDNIIKFNSEIKFCNVNFKFPNTSKSVFENLSFDIKKGSFVGLLGSSGVGKSTILNIMLGLLAPVLTMMFPALSECFLIAVSLALLACFNQLLLVLARPAMLVAAFVASIA